MDEMKKRLLYIAWIWRTKRPHVIPASLQILKHPHVLGNCWWKTSLERS